LDTSELPVTKASQRPKSILRLVAALALVAGALAIFSAVGGKSKQYDEGWNYAVTSLKSGSNTGPTGAPYVDCAAAAGALWPSSYGIRSSANYQKYNDWTQGCSDALTWVKTSGLNGLQARIF